MCLVWYGNHEYMSLLKRHVHHDGQNNTYNFMFQSEKIVVLLPTKEFIGHKPSIYYLCRNSKMGLKNLEWPSFCMVEEFSDIFLSTCQRSYHHCRISNIKSIYFPYPTMLVFMGRLRILSLDYNKFILKIMIICYNPCIKLQWTRNVNMWNSMLKTSGLS